MKASGLFSGIGGFELAFGNAGFETEMLCELDPLARSVLSSRFPEADIEEDVRDLRGLGPASELVTAGFPCQDLSMAGSKSGLDGSKSSVVDELLRLLDGTGVRTVVIENVYFMLHLDGGEAMRRLVRRLEKLGFRWAYRILDTLGFGLPQRRRRVYLVASRDFEPAAVLFGGNAEWTGGPEPADDLPVGFYWTEGKTGTGFSIDFVPPIKAGSARGIPSAPAVAFSDDRIETPSVRSALELQGFPPTWLDQRDESVKERFLWQLVGNAVSVPVAGWVAGCISEAEAPGGSGAKRPSGTRLRRGDKWPNAAWGDTGGRRFGLTLCERPVTTEWRSIAEFRNASWRELSKRALDGFSSRLEIGGLSSPPRFRERLERVQSRYEAATA